MPDKTSQEAARALYENLDTGDHADWGELGDSAKEPWLRAWRSALWTTLEPSEAEIEAAAWAFHAFANTDKATNFVEVARAALIAAARVRVGE